MSETNTLATWSVLQDLGFAPDFSVISDEVPGLSFDFGNFTLSASCLINRHFAQIVLLSGVLSTPRTLAEIEIEMPRTIESREQCAAWIVWHLDGRGHRDTFKPVRPAAWLDEGRRNIHQLPWERARLQREIEEREFNARPHCYCKREWLKLALKTLRENLVDADEHASVEISFDGKVLTFRIGGDVVAFAADGTVWPSQYSIPAENLASLPMRLSRSTVDVSIWRSQLRIDRSRYDGIVEIPKS